MEDTSGDGPTDTVAQILNEADKQAAQLVGDREGQTRQDTNRNDQHQGFFDESVCRGVQDTIHTDGLGHEIVGEQIDHIASPSVFL